MGSPIVGAALYRLIYVSQAKTPEGASTEGISDAVASEAQTSNARAGLTGLLVEISGHFIQILEGDAKTLEATFERICCDGRHSRVQVLEFCPVEGRDFEGWAMKSLTARTTSDSDALEDLLVSLQQGMTPAGLVQGALGILGNESRALFGRRSEPV